MPFRYTVLFAVISIYFKSTDGLQCYVCRGCSTATLDQVQTCEAPVTTTTTEYPLDPTTDGDGFFDENVDTVNVVGIPMLEEEEFDLNAAGNVGAVIVRTHLPGSESYKSRKLSQFVDLTEEGQVMCMVAVVLENNQETTVRGCTVYSEDPHDSCREVTGNSDILSCRLCNTDLCNSSSQLSLVFSVLILNLTIFFIV